ncbi:MAG TPA: two-component system sensor histidine kinase CreC, partial [Burkholderiaceae bacterium]
MRLGLRVFFAFFAIAGLTAFFLLRVVLAEVKPSTREVMEDMLVDTAYLLAELAAADLQAAGGDAKLLADSRFARQLMDYARRPVDARLGEQRKATLDLRIYLTDAQGRVLLDSGPKAEVGADYSRWRDVALTLRGEYGARMTREVQTDPRSNVMYVAAPVRAPGDGRLLGVVTVAKPQITVQRFIDRAEQRLLIAGLLLLALSLAIGAAVTGWLILNVRRLRDYASAAEAGQRQRVPRVPGELGDLAQAMDAMRRRLDGREHIEHTVRALTHELKSPLAAVRGAGELLQDELAAGDRQRFARQVVDQSERMRELVERMLELSKLEMLDGPARPEPLQLDRVVEAVLAGQQDRLAQRGLTVQWLRREGLEVCADRELLQLGLSNLLGNAIDFAPLGSVLELSVQSVDGRAQFSLRDHG